MAFPTFKDEAAFRKEWIAPFLAKLGFVLPKHVHGTSEQGKDFFFADHDRFGHLRFYAAQVKNGNIGAGQVELDNLLNQVRRSFVVTLKHHKGADRQRIAAVYIMTSGSISDGAREYISDACRQEHYGENVFYLDGETLCNLEKHATYIDDKVLRQRLEALVNELQFNLAPVQQLTQTTLAGSPTFEACRTLALEDALRNPYLESVIPYELPSKAWQLLKEINKRVVPYNLSYQPEQMQFFTNLSNAAFESTVKLRDACISAIAKVDDRYSLELEVEQPTEKGTL